ncbi:MAG: phenylacetate-CoA oxygenase subunit PaaJ [Bacteroidota bacterium]|nr:phenylacetate-CoA oxygenase subunit PaaJ [Bacteroidota bacterium]
MRAADAGTAEKKQLTPLEERVWAALQDVPDPEIPMISVVDLGIITGVDEQAGGQVKITMTPTFSGCPAINVMRSMIAGQVKKALGSDKVIVEVDMSIPWSSNRISAAGLKALKKAGLAPPPRYDGDLDVRTIAQAQCPYCDSHDTKMHSPFGPTLCRALHYCNSCRQAFEQFKPL